MLIRTAISASTNRYVVAGLALGIISGFIVPQAAHAQFRNEGTPGHSENSTSNLPQAPQSNINARIKRQYGKIDSALKSGQLTEQQANRLRMDVSNIETTIKNQRQANNGKLNPEQHTTAENQLNESLNQIKSATGEGTTKSAGANPLGPNWTPGPDGAQDPDALKRKMKAQERRALRQEKQSNMQAIEEQQLKYEKDVVNNLSQQKTKIEEEKQELKNVRDNSGAN